MKERRNVNGSKRNRMTLLLSLMMVSVLVLAGTSGERPVEEQCFVRICGNGGGDIDGG